MFKSIRIHSKLSATVLLLAILGAVFAFAGEKYLVDRVVAVVGGEVITLSELREASKMAPDAPLDQILEALIENMLVEIAARRQGIEVTDAEIDAMIETRMAKLKVDQDEFDKMLKAEGLTMKMFRDKLRSEVTKIKFVKGYIRNEVEVSEEEMLNYYRRHPDDFRAAEALHLAHLKLPWPLEADSQEIETVKQLAREIIKKVENGEDFAELAKKYSKSSTAANGGDLGWMSVKDMVPAFKKAVSNLQTGQVSEVIELQSGCHILFVHERKGADLVPYESVKEKIYGFLYSKKMAEEIDKVVSNLKLEIPIERML